MRMQSTMNYLLLVLRPTTYDGRRRRRVFCVSALHISHSIVHLLSYRIFVDSRVYQHQQDAYDGVVS
jgi:hypothetical protein